MVNSPAKRRAALLTVTLLASAWGLGAPSSAHAFCRTTTSKAPSGYDPAIDGCWTEGLPVYWANACIGYDIQKGASTQINYDQAATVIANAFMTWTTTTCPASYQGGGPISIDVSDLGAVDCGAVEYDQNGPNQHVIVFRDDTWPYDDSSNALALTTVSYDKDTGEIYDADMEINTAQYKLSTAVTVPPDGYDFLSIITHEAGHFLGMAHAEDFEATMYAHYTPGTETMRQLTDDDIAGICTIYAPDGTRHVSTAAASGGVLAEETCDPTPRHGFTTACMSANANDPPPKSSSCTLGGPPRGRGGMGTGGLALAGAATVLSGLRRRRRARAGARDWS